MTDKPMNEENAQNENQDINADTPSNKNTAASLEQQLEEMTRKAEENLQGWQRAQADYQNLQKETAQRMQSINKYAAEQLLLELLPMVDHFQYALQGIPEADRGNAWAKGIEYIQQNFMNILKINGVEQMDVIGKPFDPQQHEAVEEVERDDMESGTVAEVVANGFILNGKVIQVAKVKVVK